MVEGEDRLAWGLMPAGRGALGDPVPGSRGLEFLFAKEVSDRGTWIPHSRGCRPPLLPSRRASWRAGIRPGDGRVARGWPQTVGKGLGSTTARVVRPRRLFHGRGPWVSRRSPSLTDVTSGPFWNKKKDLVRGAPDPFLTCRREASRGPSSADGHALLAPYLSTPTPL